jgi:hypothetical protein
MRSHEKHQTDRHFRPGRHHDDACEPQCGEIAYERNHYYTGKYMTARDFRDEQAYFLSRHRLHNRLLHGWGVVCGLQVEPHRAECPGHVVVAPGIAIDCCGREVFIEDPIAVKVWPPDPPEQATAPQVDQTAQKAIAPPPTELQYLLYLYYAEEAIDCRPALYAEDCAPTRYEANRVRERARIGVLPWDASTRKDPRYAGCWPDAAEQLKPCAKSCDTDDTRSAGCLTPDCPCALGVPLALVTLERFNDGYQVVTERIDTSGRKQLPPPREYLTKIVDINWPHGGTVSLSELRERMGGKLQIQFDRKLAAPYKPGAGELPQIGKPLALAESQGEEAFGINRCTFVVQYGGLQRDIEFLDATRPGPQLTDDCTAAFTIGEDFLNPSDRKGNLTGNTIYVTLKCDFILDCHGNAVDGNFLGGRLPTGDGIAGGVFESWFYVDER